MTKPMARSVVPSKEADDEPAQPKTTVRAPPEQRVTPSRYAASAWLFMKRQALLLNRQHH